MAEIVILVVIEKIGIALANGVADQASAQFSKNATQLIELQGSMGRVISELRVMQDVLSQMDIRNRNNQGYEGWLDEVRKVAHRMEDIVDEYLYQIGREHDVGCCFYLKKGFRKPRSLLSLNQLASKVKEIEKDLTHLSETKNRWVPMINNGYTSSSNYIVKRSKDLASSSRSLDDEDLVGVDKNRVKLQQWLGGEDGKCSVITLYGMGGLGKTALAANIYKKDRDKFQCHAWVSISQTYSREDVLRNIINELFKDKYDVPSNIAAMDISCLEDTLKRILVQKKYLIILDDVWTPEAFDDLSRALLCNSKGSRVLITTREGDVAALASQGHILTLEPLPEDKAWDLFCKKSFSSETNHECPEDLKPLSKEIVSKCKGLPLAIVSVGSLLHVREKTVDEWRRINDQLSWEIINNPRLGHIRNVLHLSFIYLPTYLKSCFLYCSLFPEDYLFHRKNLIRLWMAEGFIVAKGASTLEEVAEGYLKELVNRNMLELVGRNSFCRMNRFRMHDIIRELAVDLCQKDRFGVKYEEDKYEDSLERDERRMVVHKLKKDIQQSFLNVHGLRTFIALDNNMPSFTILPLLSEKSRYLTVLELSCLPIEKIPDAIGDLFNLRHLGLRDTKVKLLPKSIEKLSNLLTLDLFGSHIQELPAGIVKLKNLRHLFAQKVNDPSFRILNLVSGVCITKGLSNLTNLQTLQALEIHNESVGQLGELRQLRSLRVKNVNGLYCERLCASLVQMSFLSFLDVGASDENEVLMLNALPANLQRLILRGRLAEETLLGESPLLQAMEQNLYELRLLWSQLREDPLPSLSRLANLTELRFTRAYNGEKLVFLTGWFPKLKILYLRDLPNLKQLEIKQGAVTTLERLTLVNLSSMAEVPPGIEFLLPLQFPEDYLFHRKKLVRLWMGEGFIGEKGASTLEEVAEGYLKELVNRNMIQLVGRNSFGRMNRFRMHDIMRELAIDLCQKDHFGVKYEEDNSGGFIHRDGRRLVVHNLKKDIQHSLSGLHGLRTFITLDNNIPSFTLLPLLSEKSRYMTVLELSGLPIEEVPDAIGDLFNLRHLGLRYTKVKLLQKSIEKLSNLLTLDLDQSDIQEVPAGIVKLKNLRHLFAQKVNHQSFRVLHSISGVCISKGLANLTNLQTLQALEAQDESVRQLGELRQLRSLRILNVKGIYCERLCESLVQMPFLSYLDVGASDENEVLMLSAIPPSLQKLSLRGRLAEETLSRESPLFQALEQNLYELHLRWSQLREDPLPSLSRLANLTVLWFTRAYNGEKLVFLTGWFPKLKSLVLRDLPNLKQLEIKQGAMATLESLKLDNLSSMAEVPPGIEFLLPLQFLGFREITREFRTLLRQCPLLVGQRRHYRLRK